MFPGIVFGVFFIMNFIVWVSTRSTLAIPFLTLLILLSMWIGVSLPLVFFGGFLGFRSEKIKNPKEVHKIPKLIPVQPWYMSSFFSIMMGGLLPFGAVFIEIYFVMSSIWLQKFYYLFGFLFLVFVILLLTCSEITIVMIYFQLCSSDFRWWWRSFLTAGSSSFYLFLYSGFYFFTKLRAFSHIFMSIVYFSYMFIISYFFFMLTGTIGFFATFWFVRYIYASIKTE
jgi:transmembrane 9 superfamily member 2/4